MSDVVEAILGDLGHMWGIAFRDGKTVICRCSLCGTPKPGTDTSAPKGAKLLEPCGNTVVFTRGKE